MFSKEKLTIFFNKQISNLWFHFIFWNIALFIYIFLVGDKHIFKNYINKLEVQTPYLLIIFISTVATVLFAIIDFVFSDKLMRFFPLRLMLFLKSVLYFASAFILLIAAAFPTIPINEIENYKDIIKYLPQTDIYLIRFLVFYYLACFFNIFFKAFLKKIGQVNIRKWFFGVLNKPHEDERIFMFLDLKDSTTIAEKLGHKKFSHLIQDVFNEMSMIDNYKGEVYNYLGDGAIVSWSLKKGIKNGNCLQAYFAFSKLLARKKRYYNRRYGIEPKFKAGAHVGKVMVLQIGQIRRDISYNGDTMNTAARIESKCNELKQPLLISGDLQKLLCDNKKFRFKDFGDGIQLKGKRKNVKIFGVKEFKKK